MKGKQIKTNTRHWAGITAGILTLAGYASAATLGSEKYSYDASGNIIEKSIDGKVTKMAYDQANRLTERQTADQGKQTTAYDAAGRPVAERNADGQTEPGRKALPRRGEFRLCSGGAGRCVSLCWFLAYRQ